MKLTLPLAAATVALLTMQAVMAESLVHHGGKENNSSFVYRGTSREAELAERKAEEERIAAEQAQKEMRAATRNIEIDTQETASTTTDLDTQAPEELRVTDPVSGRGVREISLEKPLPAEQPEMSVSGPEASMEHPGVEAPGANAPTPADLDDNVTSDMEATESPDSTPSVE